MSTPRNTSKRSDSIWVAGYQGLNRFWWGLRYVQPMGLLGKQLRRQDEYLAWFGEVQTPAIRPAAMPWSFCPRSPCMVGALAFHFFGVERVLSDNRGWHWRPWGENWLHNLHAFDDLVADGAEDRIEWHRELVGSWIAANSPGKGLGWKVYSLARRIANWIKWDMDKAALGDVARRNLVVQVRYLRLRLAQSMASAYPTKSGKALVLAGAYIDGDEAAAWRRTGLSVLRQTLRSGYLKSRLDAADLYRTAMLEDMLDLVQLDRVYPGLLPHGDVRHWKDLAQRLLPLDAVRRVAPLDGAEPVFHAEPKPAALRQYARELGILPH